LNVSALRILISQAKDAVMPNPLIPGMITNEALFDLLNTACVRAARRASEDIPGYDLEKVEGYLARRDVRGWSDGETIANLDLRTMAGCPDRNDPEQIATMQSAFEDAVREITQDEDSQA
jgi:hypothetical protein